MKALVLAFALSLSAAHAAPMQLWDKSKDGDPKTYTVGDYTLTFHAEKAPDNQSIAVMRVTAPGAAPGVLRAEPGYDTTLAYFGVARVDPKNPAPQVLMSTYTGGAHCCDSLKLLERAGRGWKVVDLGRWDGDILEQMPRDVDGDGIVDFALNDNDFLYAFSSYAGSWPPPLFLNVIGGKIVNVSKAPRYIPFYVKEMQAAKAECARSENGGCAGYVADAARAGRFNEAWAFMLAHYEHRRYDYYPTRCKGHFVDGKCKDTELKPRDFPEALSWFLHDHGYTP